MDEFLIHEVAKGIQLTQKERQEISDARFKGEVSASVGKLRDLVHMSAKAHDLTFLESILLTGFALLLKK